MTAGFSAPDTRVAQPGARHLAKPPVNRHIDVVKAGRESCPLGERAFCVSRNCFVDRLDTGGWLECRRVVQGVV